MPSKLHSPSFVLSLPPSQPHCYPCPSPSPVALTGCPLSVAIALTRSKPHCYPCLLPSTSPLPGACRLPSPFALTRRPCPHQSPSPVALARGPHLLPPVACHPSPFAIARTRCPCPSPLPVGFTRRPATGLSPSPVALCLLPLAHCPPGRPPWLLSLVACRPHLWLLPSPVTCHPSPFACCPHPLPMRVASRPVNTISSSVASKPCNAFKNV